MLLKAKDRLDDLDENVEKRLNRKKDFDKLLQNVRIEIEKKKLEIKNYSRQLARDMITEDIFDEMATEANKQLQKFIKYHRELKQQQEDSNNEKEYLVNSVEIIEDVLKNNKLTNADIVSLIDGITIWETDEIGPYGKKKVRVEIGWRM